MMMLKRSAIILAFLAIAGCAHAPQHQAEFVSSGAQSVTSDDESGGSEDAQDSIANPHGEVPEAQVKLPNVDLDNKLLYDFLLGEVASQRGNPAMAAQIYLDLAKTTRDPRVARRAGQLELDAHQTDKAIEALELWLQLDPGSQQARQLLVTAMLGDGRLEQARPYLVEMLKRFPDKAGHTLFQTYSLLEQNPDKQAVFNLMRDLSAPYPDVAEAHMVLSQAAASNNDLKLALDEAHRARTLKPESAMAVLMEAQLVKQDAPDRALDSLKKFLEKHPDADQVHLFYAKALLEQHKFAEAQAEFKKMLTMNPDSADLAFTVAMLSLQQGDLDGAEVELLHALDSGESNTGGVNYYLGQLEEAKKNDKLAMEYYHKVDGGEYEYAARLRVAYLLFKAGKLEDARDFLHQTETQNDEQRVQLILLESQLLRDSKQSETAYKLLQQGLEKLPDNPELLYESAMLAEQIGKHDEFEQKMRKVIELKADSAQAYNALGYSMLDRNEHLQEGMELVEKAIKLAPDDAAIMDSVGWGHYRLGDYAKSLEFLRRAYTAIPDPEIAAHLGEVLWVKGEQEQARKIWGDALKSHSDNTLLQAVMKKYLP